VTVLRRREQFTDLQWRRGAVARGDVERQAVRHHAAGVDERDGTVAQRGAVELTPGHTVRRVEQVREGELNRVLEVPALRLEVMLGQVHSLVPYHPG
jgi:hypothetical protein